MKKYFLLAIAGFIGHMATAQFIGSFTMTITSDKDPVNMLMIYTLKGSKVMMQTDMKGNKFKNIIDNEARTTTMVIEQGGRKSAIRNKFPETAPNNTQLSMAAEPKIEMTKEKQMIEGHECTKYVMEEEERTVYFWVTTDEVFNFAQAMESFSYSNASRVIGNKKPAGYDKIDGTVLKYEILSKKNKETTTVTFTNFKKYEVPDSMFDLSGYEIMEMPPMPPMPAMEKK